MKKLFSLALAAALLLTAFAACGKPAVAVPNPPLVLGEKYLTDLDYEAAVLQFDQAITIDPKNPRGYLGKADALLHLDRQADAAQALAEGAKAASGETRRAIAAAQAEAEKSPVDGYIGLSSAYEKLGWRDIALLLLKRVCGELPEEGRLKEALERLEGALENALDDTETPSTTQAAPTTEDPKAKPPLIRQNSYDADGTLQWYSIPEYNVDGRVKRSDIYYSDRPSSYNVYEYNAEGTLKGIDTHSSDGSSSYNTYEYNADGTMKRADYHSSDGSPGYITYEYNADGTLKRTDTHHSGGAPSYTTYEYNADGTLKRTDIHNLDDISVYTNYEYNADGTTKKVNYYSDGKLLGYLTFEYGTW